MVPRAVLAAMAEVLASAALMATVETVALARRVVTVPTVVRQRPPSPVAMVAVAVARVLVAPEESLV